MSRCVMFGIVMAACGLATAAMAQMDCFWIHPVGGNFSDPLRWNPTAPGLMDDAIFGDNAGGPFTVNFLSNAHINRLRVVNQRVRLDLSSHTLTLDNWMHIGDGDGADGSLELLSGSILNGNSDDQSIYIGYGDAADGVGSMTVSGAGTLVDLQNYGVSVGSGRRGRGTLTVTGGAMFKACSVGNGGNTDVAESSVGVLNVSGAGTYLQGYIGSGGDLPGQAYFSDGAHVSSLSTCNDFNHNVYIGVNAVGLLEVTGGAEWTDINNVWLGGIYFDTSDRPGHGTLRVLSGGRVTSPDSAIFVGELTNETGTVEVSGAGSRIDVSRIFGGGDATSGGGSITVGAGATIHAEVALAETAALYGTGTVDYPAPSFATLDNGGIVSPGLAAGLTGNLTVLGTYIQEPVYDQPPYYYPAGVLQIELGGVSAGAYDVLAVSGAATITGGVLNVSLVGGFTPSVGQTWNVLTCGSLTGQFGTTTLPDIGPSRFLDVAYTGTGVSLRAASLDGLSIPGSVSVGIGFPGQLSAIAQTTPFGPLDVTTRVTWNSDNPSIATVSTTGLVRGVAAGQTMIRATFQGQAAAAMATVVTPPSPPTLVRISVGSGGIQGDRLSRWPEISNDGRFTVFTSDATNLVASDTNQRRDIFLFDRIGGGVSRVCVPNGGGESNSNSDTPAISADGSSIGFFSNARNLVAGDSGLAGDVFVFNRVAATTTRVSVDSAGAEANNWSDTPSFSADGRYVSFDSSASNLVAGDTMQRDIFVRDRQTSVTTRVSIGLNGSDADGDSDNSVISQNGRIDVFFSRAHNLIASPVPATSGIYARDLTTGTTELVSYAPDGFMFPSVNGNSTVSADGRFVAFEGPFDPANILPVRIYLRDRQAGTTRLVSLDSSGAPIAGFAFRPRLTPDGRYLVFYNRPGNVLPGIGNGFRQVYRRNLGSGRIKLVSANFAGDLGDSDSSNGIQPAVSSDGRWVAFSSTSSNLVANDTNGVEDVFLADLGPTCAADWNESGQVSVQDIFDFLADYFRGPPWGDFNLTGTTTVQDIFDFLAAYFGGCS